MTIKGRTCAADFGRIRGIVVWILHAGENRALDQGIMTIWP